MIFNPTLAFWMADDINKGGWQLNSVACKNSQLSSYINHSDTSYFSVYVNAALADFALVPK